MRVAILLAMVVATLTLLLLSGAVSASDRISLCGGPGSVTVNGQPAVPGTLIIAGFGPDPQEMPDAEHVQEDGSWCISFPAEWERVHLSVDGFRVPGGPWDEAVPGVTHEVRLDVGVRTDPDAQGAFFHARPGDITLFGEPVSAGAMVCAWQEYLRIGCTRISSDGSFLTWIWSDKRDIRFTVEGFPVLGPTYDALPEHAPLQITLHAGDPERPPFEFYGSPGDITSEFANCHWSRDSIYVHAIGSDRWQWVTEVESDGSWSMRAPSGTTGVRFFVTRDSYFDRSNRPLIPPLYVAEPSGGRQEVDLDLEDDGLFVMPVLLPGSSHISSQRLDLLIMRQRDSLQWAWRWHASPDQRKAVWFDPPTALLPPLDREHRFRLYRPNYVQPCQSWFHLEADDRRLALLAFLFGRMDHALPWSTHRRALETVILWMVLADRDLIDG